MESHNSTAAIKKSLIANFSIGVTKLVSSVFTGSGTLMAEAIHSFADCGNQLLLMIGLKRSELEPSRKNPMGYARETYFWSLLVGVLMFFLGGVFSIYEGIEHILHPEPLKHVGLAVCILFIAAVIEGWALRGALDAIQNDRGNRSYWKWFRDTRSSEMLVLVVEDVAALSGLAIAFVALFLAWITGNPLYDAIGGIMVGTLLAIVAVMVTREIHNLIIGEAADNNVGITIRGIADEHGFYAHHLILIQHGHEIMASIKLEPLNVEMTLSEAIQAIIDFEKEVRTRMPQCRWIFCEPSPRDNAD
jgi:cation diffusion facilitator family transporter